VTSQRDRVQLTLFQLDNYGPWTVTPAPRRETDLQALQARVYASVADFVGRDDGYAFFDRFDNMIAVTNGIDEAAHATFQEWVRTQFPVTVSAGIGTGDTPVDALEHATQAIQAAGSAQSATRTEVLAREGTQKTSGELTVVHFDVVDATGTYTDRVSAGDAGIIIKRAAVELDAHLQRTHGAIANFVGGDNTSSRSVHPSPIRSSTTSGRPYSRKPASNSRPELGPERPLTKPAIAPKSPSRSVERRATGSTGRRTQSTNP